LANHWLLVSDKDTWATLVEKGFWKLGAYYRKRSRKIRKEDKAVAYVKYLSAIYGIVNIKSEAYETKQDSKYPIMFDIEPDVFLSEPTSIKPLINNLSFVSNKRRWFSVFHTSLRRIPEKKDFELFREYIIRESLKDE